MGIFLFAMLAYWRVNCLEDLFSATRIWYDMMTEIPQTSICRKLSKRRIRGRWYENHPLQQRRLMLTTRSVLPAGFSYGFTNSTFVAAFRYNFFWWRKSSSEKKKQKTKRRLVTLELQGTGLLEGTQVLPIWHCRFSGPASNWKKFLLPQISPYQAWEAKGSSGKLLTISSWWLNQPIWKKYYIVKLDHFPR